MDRLILDLDCAKKNLCDQLSTERMPGLWGVKCGDLVLEHGASAALKLMPLNYSVFIDLKHFDVEGRLARIVELYANLGAANPKFLTVSGKRPVQAIKSAVKKRGTIDIIVTGPLSDDFDADEEEVADTLDLVYESGAQGLTCPAWLLPHSPIKTFDGHVVATGVVSEGVKARHHFNPRPLEFALDYGATHFVVGGEVIDSPDPMRTLIGLLARNNKHLLEHAPAQ